VAAVGVGKKDVENTRHALSSFQREIPIFAAPRDIDATLSLLSHIISQHQLTFQPLDGAIVSTISAFNFPIVRLCLASGLDVLVEKPATCPPNCAWDSSQAEQIFPQMLELVQAAESSGTRLVIGAQRRYEAVYKKTLEKLHEHRPLETIQVSHTLGWGRAGQVLANNYPGWRRLPEFTGGKIMHSGYHVIDIVMWWLKHINPDVRRGKVSSSFKRFTYPKYIVNGENRNIEKTAVIQVQFFNEDQLSPTCIATFIMSLGGPYKSTREAYLLVTQDETRLTIERDVPQQNTAPSTIMMQQDGQTVLNDITPKDAEAGNQEPTRDFINGLLQGPPGTEISAGFDHLHSAQSVQAAYLSAIRGTAEEVTFV
jgi:predicted dehydrogenase